MKYKRKNQAEALAQIVILVVATIAFAWMVGSEIQVVSADPETDTHDCGMTCVGNVPYTTKWSDASGKCIPNTRLEPCPLICQGGICKTEADDDSWLNTEAKDIVTNIGTGLLSTWANAKLGDTVSQTVNVGTTGGAGNVPVVETTGGGFNLMDFLFGENDAAIFWGEEASFQNVLSNAAWAVATVLIINYFASEYASTRNANDIETVGWITAGTWVAFVAILTALGEEGPPGWIAAIVVIVAVGAYMLSGYQIYSREIFTYRTGMWQPLAGGSKCNKCNLLEVGGENACSEYICHTYGAACDWLNDESDYETCIEVNKGDKAPAIITPVTEIYGESVFPSNLYEYVTSSANSKIIYKGEGGQCVPAFTAIKLAFTTNENANCRISLEEPIIGESKEERFENMMYIMEGSSYTKNHTMNLASIITASEDALAVAGYTLTNGGNYKFYLRCIDVQGNINNQDYLMGFCVQKGPDTNPPEITATYPSENSFQPYGIVNVTNFEVYTNEPADCRWGHETTSYQFMPNEFTKCSQNINDPIGKSSSLFGCSVNLTGFESGVLNKYYVACIDQPELKLKGAEYQVKRNAGKPVEITFRGTEQLIIDEITINGKENGTIIEDKTNYVKVNVKVTALGGAEDGKIRCSYSPSETGTYSKFYNENSREYLIENIHEFSLSENNYLFYISCTDVALNSDSTMINFTVKTDILPPNVTRIYNEEGYLKLITDEPGECVFSTIDSDCKYIFDEGTPMSSNEEGTEHYAEWKIEDNYYIKCRDQREIGPTIGECSIIVRPFDTFEEE